MLCSGFHLKRAVVLSDKQNWHRVASVAEIEVDEALAVSVGDIEIALCNVDGTIYAINNICTHEYASLADGLIEGDAIECPLHQAQFHIPTGKVLSSPAEVDLETYPVRVEGDEVYVQVTNGI